MVGGWEETGAAEGGQTDAEGFVEAVEDGAPMGRLEGFGDVGGELDATGDAHVVELWDELVDLGDGAGNGGAGAEPIKQSGDRDLRLRRKAAAQLTEEPGVLGECGGGAIEVELEPGDGESLAALLIERGNESGDGVKGGRGRFEAVDEPVVTGWGEVVQRLSDGKPALVAVSEGGGVSVEDIQRGRRRRLGATPVPEPKAGGEGDCGWAAVGRGLAAGDGEGKEEKTGAGAHIAVEYSRMPLEWRRRSQSTPRVGRGGLASRRGLEKCGTFRWWGVN